MLIVKLRLTLNILADSDFRLNFLEEKCTSKL